MTYPDQPYGQTAYSQQPYGQTSYPSSPPPQSGDEPAPGGLAETAADTAQAGKQAARDVASTATEQAKEVASEAVDQVRDLVGQAKGQLRDQVHTQHGNLVGNLQQLADQLHRMSTVGDERGLATDLVGQAGEHTRTVASWLEQRQPADVLGEVRSFARRRPGAFLLGALAAGVAAGRLTRGGIAVHRDGSGSQSSGAHVEAGSSGAQLEAASATAQLPTATNGYSTGAYGAEPVDPVAPSPETGYSAQTGYGLPQ